MISAGSNVVQNFQMAKQNRLQEQNLAQQAMQTELLAASNQMQAQQLAMEQERERKRLEIIERRKLLVKFESLCDRAPQVFSEYPEYSTMMMENARDYFQNSGLGSDNFEEISDMERSSKIYSRITEMSMDFRTKLDESQTFTLSSMNDFLNSEGYLLEEHTRLCQDVEQMSNSEERLKELLAHKKKLDSLHEERTREFRSDLWKRTKQSFALFAIGIVIAAAGVMAFAGECLEYDEDEVCQTYENDSAFIGSVFVAMILGLPLSVLPFWAIYAFFQSRESRRQWAPYEQEFVGIESLRLRVISNDDRFQMLSEKFQSSSSSEIIDLRNKKIDWINELSPKAHEINLNF